MMLIVVYVGAVAVLFLFVIMMLDVDFVELREGFIQYLPIGIVIGGIFLFELLLVVGAWVIKSDGAPRPSPRRSRPTSPTPRRSVSCSTRSTSITSSSPAWCCWSR